MTEMSPAEAVFFQALKLATPIERERYLERACGQDKPLRARVEKLLAASPRVGGFLGSQQIGDVTGAYDRALEQPGKTVGPYKLLQQIGEGGMGVVFMAEQEEPIRRKVALKIIKPGMDSRQVVARFEAERQALAMMDHANIARVFDGGATDSGRPYFVMELVHGVPIVEYCDANKLTPRERLELFVPVCQAIQHAHQKGIIHRDVKPSNVLVTMYDDKPVPKVIDFGVAKAIEQKLTEKTLFTQYGALVGTFEYMSPEQAEMNALGVDTRTDVYSLGVLLYELLTGTTPLDRARLREAAFGEIVRLIKEEDPPQPSVRLSTSQTLAKLAATRKTEPAKLSALMRGDLDWIVMRCLEKDRSRRYDGANALIKDVQRHLAGDAVDACPPTLGYRLRKYARKNRVLMTTVGAVAAALVFGMALTTWQAVRTRAAESEAARQRDVARHNEDAAVTAQAAANREREKVAQANDDLTRLTNAQRRTLYDAEMNLAQAAWESGNATRTLELLQRQTPQIGAEDLRDFEWYYWNALLSKPIESSFLPGGGAASREFEFVELSAHAKRAIYYSRSSNCVRVIDLESGKEVWKLPVLADKDAFEFRVTSVSADGNRFVTHSIRNDPAGGGGSGHVRTYELRVWQVQNDKPLFTSVTNTPGALVWGGRLSPDGAKLSVTGRPSVREPGYIRVFEVDGGAEILRYPPRTQDLHVTFDGPIGPDGKKIPLLVTDKLDEPIAKREFRVVLLDAETGKAEKVIDRKLDGLIPQFEFSPDGTRLALRYFESAQGHLEIWDLKSRAIEFESRSPQFSRMSHGFRFSPTGRSIAAPSSTQILLVDLDAKSGLTGVQKMRALAGHTSRVASVAFDATGTRLVAIAENGKTKVWDLTEPPPPARATFSNKDRLLSPDLKLIAESPGLASTKPLRLTDAAGNPIGNSLPYNGYVTNVAFANDGRTFVYATVSVEGCTLAVYDAPSAQKRFEKSFARDGYLGVDNLIVSPNSGSVCMTTTSDDRIGRARNDRIAAFDGFTGR